MGGGVAMRAAAKVAGLGVLNGGLHGENPVVSAARQATCSAAAIVSSPGDVKLAIAHSKTSSSIEKPYVEIDDWELTGVEDELFMEKGEPMPRLVFGGAPTIQEAKQATSDLNDALEKAYLSRTTANRLADSSFGEKAVTPSAPKPAIQAFKLLHESSAAQKVVASIASDSNVWDAVMQNEDLVDFLQTHKTSVVFPDMDQDINDSFACNEIPSPKASEPKSKGFMDYMGDIKQKITDTVVEMMNSLSDTFQSLFGGSRDEYTVNPDGTAGVSAEKATIGATLMGLAIMAIMVVALKRG